jgi:DNA-binding SARP family transcriptional activator
VSAIRASPELPFVTDCVVTRLDVANGQDSRRSVTVPASYDQYRRLKSAPIDVGPSRLFLLGGFKVSIEAQSVELAHGAQRLVAFLALEGRQQLRLYVANKLWLDLPEERAAACLRSLLWQVRHRVPALLEVTKASVGLAQSVEIDVDRFLAMTSNGSPPTSEIQIGEIRELAASPELLPGWYEDWVVLQRERVRQLRLHALEMFGERLIQMGRFADAIEAGLAAVNADPLRESSHRLVIRAHLGEGNRIEAVRQFAFYQHLMRSELGLEPSQDMVALVRDVRVRHDLLTAR